MSVRVAALWSMGAQYASFAFQFFTSVVVSRYFLAPEDVGLFSIALAVVLLIAILQDFGLSRYIAGLPSIDQDDINTCMSIATVAGILVVAAIFIGLWPVAYFYDDMRLVPLLVIIGASYLLTPFYLISTALMSRDLDFRGLFFTNVLAAAIMSATVIGLAWAGYGAASLAWGMVTQALVKALAAQVQRPVKFCLPLTFTRAKNALSFGKGSAALIVIGAVGVRTPDLIIGRMIDMAAVGLFSRAAALPAQLYMLLSGAIGGVFYPAFARIRDRGEALGAPYLRVVSGYCAVTMPAMAGLAMAAEPLVLNLYGPNWSGAAPLLQLLAISEIAFIMMPLHMDIPILLGRMQSLIRYNLLDSAAAVLLLIIGAWWGLEAAALSRIGYTMVWYALYAPFLSKLIGFDWREMILIYIKSAAVSLAAIVPLACAYMFWTSPGALGIFALLALSGSGVVCWGIAMVLVRHPATDEIIGLLQTLAPRLFINGDRKAG
jgi:O-antigen/teichoic acid export membrane protein